MLLFAQEYQINNYSEILKGILGSAVDGIILSNEKGVIIYLNESACILFGYSKEELLGQKLNILMPVFHSEKHDSYIRQYLETGEARIIGIGREVTGKRKDGKEFPFFLSVSAVPLGDRIIFTGMIHDLSLQRQAEQDVENISVAVRELEDEVENRGLALEKERELNQLKSRFVSMASHEFRTPLSTILSSASLMVSYSQTEQQAHRERHFNRIKSSIEQLTSLLNDFLSISKLEEGKIEHQPEWFVFKDFLLLCFEDLQSVLKKGQFISHNLSDDDFEVFLDGKLLKNIVTNLITNASKYSSEGAEIKTVVEKSEKLLIIKVIDCGIGIPTEEQTQLFNRFFRAHNASNIQGTGLGLNIVKKYLDLMNGTITFNSQEGIGSEFVVSLNVIQKDPSQNR